MAQARSILIVHHPGDDFDQIPYMIQLFIQHWQEQNIPVEIRSDLHRLPDKHVIVIPHLDATLTPAPFQRFFEKCPIVLNRNVTDISKRKISQNLVTSAADHDGPVIVKTNHNAGGEPERRKLRQKGIAGRALLAVARQLPWHVSGILGPFTYRIYPHPRQVPRPAWHNPRLVVEKFLPERQGDLYCLRQYLFFGSRELNLRVMGPNPIVKARNVTQRQVLAEIPQELRTLRAELGFDYGKFDYVIHDDKVILLDAARTPTYNPASPLNPSLRELACGIDAFNQSK